MCFPIITLLTLLIIIITLHDLSHCLSMIITLHDISHCISIIITLHDLAGKHFCCPSSSLYTISQITHTTTYRLEFLEVHPLCLELLNNIPTSNIYFKVILKILVLLIHIFYTSAQGYDMH